MWALFKPVEVICPQWAFVFPLLHNWKALVWGEWIALSCVRRDLECSVCPVSDSFLPDSSLPWEPPLLSLCFVFFPWNDLTPSHSWLSTYSWWSRGNLEQAGNEKWSWGSEQTHVPHASPYTHTYSCVEEEWSPRWAGPLMSETSLRGALFIYGSH